MCCCKKITQEEFANMNLLDLVEYLKKLPTKTLKDLRFSDLYQPENSCNGIYFITSPDHSKFYIGKASSRSVAERISPYFDSRRDAFFNSFLRNRLRDKSLEISSENLHLCYLESLDWQISVLFIERNDETFKTLISFVESLLIYHFNRKYNNRCINGTNRRRDIDINSKFITQLQR